MSMRDDIIKADFSHLTSKKENKMKLKIVDKEEFIEVDENTFKKMGQEATIRLAKKLDMYDQLDSIDLVQDEELGDDCLYLSRLKKMILDQQVIVVEVDLTKKEEEKQ